MLEAVGVAAICVGAVAVAVGGLAAVAVIFSPSLTIPEDRHGISEQEFRERLRANYESVYMYTGFGGFPRTVLSRSTAHA